MRDDQQNTQEGQIIGAWVPGLPHIMKSEANEGYQRLGQAMVELGDSLYDSGVRRLLYYSTQWLSVLGQSFQAREDLQGKHVDENWHDFGALPFAFRVDRPFAEAMAQGAEGAGFQTKLVDYEGFPVDTGTIVADHFLNKGRFRTNMVSSCVYSDGGETVKLAGALRQVINAADEKTAIIAVSGLSGRFFTTEIDMREDHIRDPQDDQWNRRILDLWANGEYTEIERLIPEYTSACKVDMGFKAYSFLQGAGLAQGCQVLAYEPVYGTGAAVLRIPN